MLHRFHGFLYGGAPSGMGAARRASRVPQARRWHPDLNPEVQPAPQLPRGNADVAVDFVDMSAVVDRIHAAFFHHQR